MAARIGEAAGTIAPAGISVQLYSVRSAMALDPQVAIGRLAALGLTQVEPYRFHLMVDDLERAFADHGVTAPSAHAPLLSMDDPGSAFAAAQRLGIGVVIDPATPPEAWATRAGVEGIARRLGELAHRAADAGVRVGYHNHYWEFAARVEGAVAFDVFADALDPGVVLEIDTYWVEVGGQSAPAVLRALGDRVEFIHAKDGPLTRDTKAQVALGLGAMDVPAVLAAAPRAVRVIEFDDTTGDVFDGIAASLSYLRAAEPEV